MSLVASPPAVCDCCGDFSGLAGAGREKALISLVALTRLAAAELNRRFDSGPPSPSDPLFCRPGDQSFDDLWDQEQHDGAAEVFAHGFHVAALEFYRGNSHKEGGGGDYRPGSSPPRLDRCLSWRLRIARRHLNARVWILMDRCCCGGQVDDNSEGFSVASPFGVAPLEQAPVAQHRTLLVVDKGYSCTRATGRGLSFRSSRLPAPPPPRVDDLPWGRMSKLAEDRLARLLHEFANKRPFSIIGLRGEIDV
jgi:hypothetical protein